MTTAYLCSSSLPKSRHLISLVLRVKETTKAHKVNKRIILIELTLTCKLLALVYVLLLYLISTCFLSEDSGGGGVSDES